MPTPVDLFSYHLPPHFIAQRPLEPRDASKLMVLDRFSGQLRHRVFGEILDELRPGDVLVFNTSKVFRARVPLQDGEVFFLRLEEREAEVLLRPGKRFRVGEGILLPGDMRVELLVKGPDGVCRVRTGMAVSEVLQYLEVHGEMPTPPYVEEKLIEEERYQTVYAREVGSVAAPTAGLHFTPELLEKIKEKGAQIEEITLHVGLGTFRPVQTDTIEDHVMHAEYVEVRADVAERIHDAKREGRRVIAVGTTTVRTLEGIVANTGSLGAYSGPLNVFITPGFEFTIIDGLITNFHLPKSTLLMLVSAFAGREHILAAYEEAKKMEYRFFSFGDAMLIV